MSSPLASAYPEQSIQQWNIKSTTHNTYCAAAQLPNIKLWDAGILQPTPWTNLNWPFWKNLINKVIDVYFRRQEMAKYSRTKSSTKL